jgi:hypothetical protein
MNPKTYVFIASALLGMLMIPSRSAYAMADVHCYFTWDDNATLNVKHGRRYVNKRVRNPEFNRLVAMGKVVARVAADRGSYCQLNHPENTRIDTQIEKLTYRLDRSGRIPNCADLNAMVECRGGRFLDTDADASPAPASPSARPNIIVSEFSLNPAVPVRGQAVQVRIGVYNNGTAPAGPYRVEWYPGENYREPACSWNVPGNNVRGGRILNCTYPGYPSWYAGIRTKVVADPDGHVNESNESDNTRLMQIRVAQ